MASLKEHEALIKKLTARIEALELASASGGKPVTSKKEKLEIPTEPVEVGDGKYLFTRPNVRALDGSVVLTKTIQETPDEYKELLEHLVKTGSGALRLYHE